MAVVAADLPGLDASSITRLLRGDVRTVAVGDEGMTSLGRIGITEVVGAEAVDDLVEVVRRAASRELVEDPVAGPDAVTYDAADDEPGRTVVVWGPTGAPGRTTVAIGLAAELARRHGTAGGARVVLADLDPYGGAVAQTLGVLDEVSGLLAAARLGNAGELDARRFAACRRVVAGMEVLTGLPRADRWVEVREAITTDLLGLAAARGDVVVDTGFCLEDDDGWGRGAGRNRMTLEALQAADDVVVVGSADPVGLSRLARALVELGDVVPGVAPWVVVNRMRDRLGWSEHDITGMVEGFTRPLGVAFLPDDQAACDRAAVGGKTLVEVGESALGQAMCALAERVVPAPARPLAGRRAGGRRQLLKRSQRPA
ncbi:hypothetical protein D9V37_08325 [Nocardioides mangrovicus]|uniref:Chromosome partitioning protein n=1 Tax=Nocardioides mangrovicus TaxID=2478913 RepID=A0A3L8P4A4_9ACTN|nr:hypothetical protein D9V37_08325 [Nocardioides mangrovicus]